MAGDDEELWRTSDRRARAEQKAGDRRQEEREQEVISVMATAIKAADTSIINEDYLKQARAALIAVREAGWDVVPEDLPDAAVAAMILEMPYGPALNVVTYLDKMWEAMRGTVRRLWGRADMSSGVRFPTDNARPGDF